MVREVLAVVVRVAASTEEVTRKVSMTTSVDSSLCKRRLEQVDEVGSSLGGREWASLVVVLQRGRPACGTGALLPVRFSARGVVGPRRAWFSAFLCSSPSIALAINISSIACVRLVVRHVKNFFRPPELLTQ